MQPTHNVPTYQTRAHWALCPHITDFLQRADGEIVPLFRLSLQASKSFSDHWMHVGSPALLWYAISFYWSSCMLPVKHNRRQQMVGGINKKKTYKDTYDSVISGICSRHQTGPVTFRAGVLKISVISGKMNPRGLWHLFRFYLLKCVLRQRGNESHLRLNETGPLGWCIFCSVGRRGSLGCLVFII